MKRIENAKRVYERLIDNESRAIFDARLNFIFEHDVEKLINEMWDVSSYKKFTNSQLESFFLTHNKKKVIIFGAGKKGQICKQLLLRFDIFVSFYCDNDSEKVGTIIDGIPCLSVDEVCQNYRDYSVIPISPLYRKDLFDQLVDNFFPQENILYLRGGELLLNCENQYFDFDGFNHSGKNVFIDAGSYDGQTTDNFIEWCNGKYDRIFCFEPNRNNYETVVKKFELNKKVKIINAGTWNCEGKLSFNYAGPASKIVIDESKDTINVTAIDNIVKSENVTFIKMDVEGAELESIWGAQKTIKTYKPDLAICVYHKWLDFIDLPATILELEPNYKFAFRHYSNNTTETVLYAFVN